MKRFIPLIFVLFICCKQQYPSIPSDIIQPEKMKLILIDMHLADAVSETKSQGGMNEKMLTEGYYEQIYKNHQVTREDFIKSYHFYEYNPVLLNRMYDEILSEMSKRESNVGK